MYTRCPSCRAEISFEPPLNAASLPDGYKHRIKCPSCGVTIGVKIPRVNAATEIQPTYRPANPNATAFEPVYNAAAVVGAENAVKAKPAKKKGRGRNFIMLLFSLAFVAFSVVAYLINTGVIAAEGWVMSLAIFSGISGWESLCTEFEIFKLFMQSDSIGIILTLLVPMILFALAAINTLVSLISLIGGKYGRAYNLIMSALMGACACLLLFTTYITMGESGGNLGTYFKDVVITGEMYFWLVGAAVGALQFIFSLFFLKSLKIKQK